MADWTRGRLRFELEKKEIHSLYDLDRANRLPLGTCSNTITEPHRRGEQILAAAVGRRPHVIWPSRYDKAGIRLSPQPVENYRRAEPVGHRQKAKAA